jgi:hypothetical protein
MAEILTHPNYKHHRLNSSWNLWYHNPNDNNWEMDSYQCIPNIDTIEKVWEIFHIFGSSHFQSGMFFFMRGDIKPMWEDTQNVNGGCWSFRVNKKEVNKTWLELAMALLGESLTSSSTNSLTINGISISPKKSFSIIKIWNNNKELNDSILLNQISGLNMDEIMYKPHVESIDKDREKRLNKHNDKPELNMDD